MKAGKKSAGKKQRFNPTRPALDAEPPFKARGKANKSGVDAESPRQDEMEEDGSQVISQKLSKKILREAQKQLQEEQKAEEQEKIENSERRPKWENNSSKMIDDDNELEEDDEEDDGLRDGDYFVDDIEVDEADERAMKLFMRPSEETRKTLADIVMEKIREHENRLNDLELANTGEENQTRLHPKVVRVYQGVGETLAHYRSGKIPKAFRMIPSLRNWEEILWLTHPENWTPHAHFVSTKIFASNFNIKMAQRYYNLFLLPAVRDDIQEHKKLNYHLYRALKKALFKPAAFYKGILLPLIEGGDCTLRESVIIGSVVSKVSVPVLESAGCIMRLSQLPYSPASSLLLSVLFNKKYALPYRVIDSIIVHFSSFVNEMRTLPVIWHKSLLIFVQRYKNDLLHEQKVALRELCKIKNHHMITNEVLRELNTSRCRGEIEMELG